MRSRLVDDPGVRPQFAPRIVIPGATMRQWRVRPVAVVQLAIASLFVAQLGRIPFLNTSDRAAPLLATDVLVLAVIAVGGIAGILARSVKVDRVGGLALLFAAVGAFMTLLAIPRYGLTGFEIVISLAYLARWTAYFLVYLVVINVVKASDVSGIWRTLERTILAFSAFGLVQAAFIPHFAQRIFPNDTEGNEWDQQGYRLVSTVLDPNIAGAMILLVLLVQIAQLAGGSRQAIWKPFLLFSALVATLSRSAFVGLLVGAAIILAVYGVSRRLLRVAALIGVLVLAALPKIVAFAQSYNKLRIDGSALTRLTMWLKALRIFSDHPVFGIGFNTFAFVQERYGYVRLGRGSYALDGGLIFIAVMTGLVGVALYVGIISVVVSRCRRVWRDAGTSPEWRALAAGIGAGAVAIVVNSLFINSLLTSFVMEMLWIFWGLAFVMARDRASA